jgi:hypothetical protein
MLAEFEAQDGALGALRALSARGHRALDAFSPYPAPALAEALDAPRPRLGPPMLVAGAASAAIAYAVEWWSAVVDYPLNVGGRALNSWPAFLVAPVEVGFLTAAVAGLIAMFREGGLPRLHHPAFQVAQFERATQDRFFVLAETAGSGPELRVCLEQAGALSVTELRP